jgi:hypothetical protein
LRFVKNVPARFDTRVRFAVDFRAVFLVDLRADFRVPELFFAKVVSLRRPG